MIAATMSAVLLTGSAAAPPACRFVTRPIAAGAVIDQGDTAARPCSGTKVTRKLRYDRGAKVARAAVDLAAGDELGSVFVPKLPGILPGDRVAIVARLGPVQVSKDVTALQPGRPGRWLFVRDDAGKVFRAPMPRMEDVR